MEPRCLRCGAPSNEGDGHVSWETWDGQGRTSCFIDGVDHFSEVYSRAWHHFSAPPEPSPSKYWHVKGICYLIATSDMANWKPKGEGWEAVAWPDKTGVVETRARGETEQAALDALAKMLMGRET
jgi:hypothetical protein